MAKKKTTLSTPVLPGKALTQAYIKALFALIEGDVTLVEDTITKVEALAIVNELLKPEVNIYDYLVLLEDAPPHLVTGVLAKWKQLAHDTIEKSWETNTK